MEIGSLAEWVEGLGELLAVSVALFLPYYQQRQENKKKNQRAKQVIISTAGTLLDQTEIQKSPNFVELQQFVSIYAVLSTNSKTINIIELGDNILDTIADNNVLNHDQKQIVKQNINDLKKLKI
ncbi:hypothetical protein [Companilactobacillus nantensis]|uniref:Uncharacterized protein n=1 Tax=Companilactobacillus nantensis DSM 16982 TaxID=1423774 RepID=A0A0R1WL52_9LACO|nr:hypothetical protein [Companilactobacillus nantensis]KRM18237.1 hypothetical protein FD31_GL001567 [Companilactobacillus nantensis DSM 16982]GEO62899.1 hypothetical protein LNA01_00820 [Companilactobacillus nantensis]